MRLFLFTASIFFSLAGAAHADVIEECKPWEHREGSGHGGHCELGPCSIGWDGSEEFGFGVLAVTAGAVILRRRARKG
jgi:hypothetical protein